MNLCSSKQNTPFENNSLGANTQLYTQNKSIGEKDHDSGSKVLKKIKLPSTPTAIVKLEKKMILIGTEDNCLYLLSLKDYYYK